MLVVVHTPLLLQVWTFWAAHWVAAGVQLVAHAPAEHTAGQS